MKARKCIWIFVLIALVAGAAAEEKIESYNEYSSLELNFGLVSGIKIERAKSDARIDSLVARIGFYPRANAFQQVLSLEAEANPEARSEVTPEAVIFEWTNNPQESYWNYRIQGRIKTSNTLPRVMKEIKFPLQKLENEVLKYTKATEFIDIDENIESQARTLAAGETDLFVAVFKIADWVRSNIKYDLSTLTAEAVQKSSWVLNNREGVCDEITNLFISMLRSLGVPARFVSGMVYSNLDYKFGAHGWAEVYFPDIGWVPFDVTFGQYGWLDPSHLKLNDNSDSGSPSAEYNWRAFGVEVKIDDLDLETSVASVGSKVESPVILSLEPYRKAVSPGSYVPLLVTVQNKRDIYVSTSVIIKKAPKLSEKNVKEVLLRPKETKTLAWTLEIPQEADEGFIYTSAIEATSSYGGIAASEIKYAKEYEVVSPDQAKAILASYQEKSRKKEFASLQLRCSPDKKLYYSNDKATISCNIKNLGDNVIFYLCLREDCQSVSIENNKEREAEFSLKVQDGGRLLIVAENEESIKHVYIDLNVIKVADIALKDVKPKSVHYKDVVDVTLTLRANSEIYSVDIDFGYDVLHYDTFDETREIVLKTNGRTILQGMKLGIKYKDAAGKIYEKVEKVNIEVTEVPWYIRFPRWFASLF